MDADSAGAASDGWQRSFEALQAEVSSAGATPWCVSYAYADEAAEGQLSGFRAVHTSGFVLDVLWATVVPQALMWVNAPLDSDRGDAHTCEHLLLGKGSRGRAVAQQEEMLLAHSTAWTGRLRTCYTFQCAAGVETFCALFGAKLQALLAPDATDVEIAREVCHVGPFDGDALEEKGTVYTEMLGSFAQPNFCAYHALNRLLFDGEAGDDSSPQRSHPLSFEAGGTPQSIRTAEPHHLHAFHNSRYLLGGMGTILAVSPLLAAPSALLQRIHTCLVTARDTPRPWRQGGDADTAPLYPAVDLEEAWLPPSRPAPPGTQRIVRVPIADGTAPGQLVAAWPDVMPPEQVVGPDASIRLSLLHLLVELVAGGATSELHAVLVATETRTCDVGATGVSGYVSGEPGRAVCISLGGLPPSALGDDAMRRVADTMRAAFSKVAAAADESPTLLLFNRRALSHLRTMARSSCQFLSAPPRFGVRGVHDEWLTHLNDARRCARAGATTVHLSFVTEAAALEAMLKRGTNIWAPHIAAWGLAARAPLVVATRADPAFAEQLERERATRLRARVDAMLQRERELAAGEQSSATDVDAAALRAAAFARFRSEYDAETSVLEAHAAGAPSPGPPPDPPMAEDQLDVVPLALPGGRRLFAARFVGLTGGHAGLAFSLAGVPRRLLCALAALPTYLRSVGVTTRAGRVLDYRQLCSALQDEVLYLDPNFTVSRASGRVELQLRAAGLTVREALAALGWLEAMLTAPDSTPACLPRVRDAVDAALSSARGAVEHRGEFWQDGFAAALLPATSPVHLLAENAIARAHALHRLRWRLRDPPADASAFAALLKELAGALRGGASRVQLDGALAAAGADGGAWPAGVPGCGALYTLASAASPALLATFRAAAADLRAMLPAVPDSSLRNDWPALCLQLAHDAAEAPACVLCEWGELLVFLRCRARARAFLAAGPAHLMPLAATLRALVARLPAGYGPFGPPDAPPLFPDTQLPAVALRRAAARGALPPPTADAFPPYCALIIPRLAVGGVVSMASCASYADDLASSCDGDEAPLLDLLAAQTVAGGGSHSLFMRCWAAGLAYSCGVSASLADGRVRYYADTCPDVGKTLAAAAAEVARDAAAPPVAWRAEYALAQCLTSRAGTGMPESRTEAASTDEADGRPEARVHAMRAHLLRLRSRANLADELHRRASRVLGALLPGVTAPLFASRGWSGARRAPGATLVVVGSESQAAGVDAHLAAIAARTSTQAPSCVRLYERDLWMVADEPPAAPATPGASGQAPMYAVALAALCITVAASAARTRR